MALYLSFFLNDVRRIVEISRHCGDHACNASRARGLPVWKTLEV